MMFVYITQAGEGGPVKIGFSARLGDRMRTLEIGQHEALRVLRVIEGGRETERWMHERFAARHRKGEWFDFHPDMLTVIPPDPDTLSTSDRKECEETQELLHEMRKCILQVSSDQPPETNITERIKVAAARFAMSFGRLRSFYYLVARIVSASEADRIRSITRAFLSEYADQLELKVRQIRLELSDSPRRARNVSRVSDAHSPDLLSFLDESTR